MKKTVLILIFTYLSYPLLYSQEINYDMIKVRCLYHQSSVMDTLNIQKKTVDLMLLDIGDNVSKYHPFYVTVWDSVTTAMIGQNKTPNEVASAILKLKKTSFVTDYVIYKNHPKGNLTFVDYLATVYYTYKEPMPTIQWSLKNDTATVLGYLCKKAITTFRGRNYEVWYALEIPIRDGPWKFCGLPGLILKAQDDQAYFSFVCTSIEFPNSKLIEIRNSDRTKLISKTAYNDAKQRYMDNRGKFVSGDPLFTANGDAPAHNFVKKPYNPIERTEE
jgi:GLPGLI family protein